MARTRAARFATLQEGLIGVNRFPSIEAPPIAVLDVAPRAEPDRAGALPCLRDALPFEALRDAAQAMSATPTVFLATLGPPAAHGARATYAANVFAAAGIAAHAAAGTRDIPTLIADFEASGTAVACLCGTDKAYTEAASTLVPALRGAGARRVFVAGQQAADRHDTGIDAFIYDGCSALDVLEDAIEVLSRRPAEPR